ncbi:Protein DA1-related 1 [Vitis vinifera]|uniref:Protein DA1-related 1 n=1 Tax=Vitis vinifera TaxID=29760 RepID=A0A438ERS6_VITVI|nr:Protein DA1-related 1 [Vitis vinifera]
MRKESDRPPIRYVYARKGKRSVLPPGVWHPECFRCHGCGYPISDYEIPTNPAGLIEYRAHPFWVQKYCPSHEHDRTPRCCSCERMEPRDTRYVALNDGRKLCLECLDSAIMDTNECQPLYLDIQEFYEGLNMKVQQQVPLLLVERQALNEAMEGEKSNHGSNEACSTKLYEDLDMTMKQQVSLLCYDIWGTFPWNAYPYLFALVSDTCLGIYRSSPLLNKFICFLVLDQGHHHMPETRGLCLSEEQTVSTILRRPKIGTGNRVMNMITEPCKLTRRCDVTAVLILYGLPSIGTSFEVWYLSCMKLKKFRDLRILSYHGNHPRIVLYHFLSLSQVGAVVSISGIDHALGSMQEMLQWLVLMITTPKGYQSIVTLLLTGSILAHEMMHAWLRLNGYRTLAQDVEEGICQVLAYMWLDAELTSGSGSNVPSTSSASTSSKKGAGSQCERKLGQFFKHQIESDTSLVYGAGFRAGHQAVLKYGLPATLKHIHLTGNFPY